MAATDFKTVLKLTLFLLLALPASLFAQAADEKLIFSLTEWDVGELEYGLIADQKVEITNNTQAFVNIDLVSTCSCMSVEPGSFGLAPGESSGFTIYFDSHDDEGEFEKILIIQTDSEAMPKGFFLVYGTVIVPEGETAGESSGGTGDQASGNAAAEPAEPAEPGEAELLYYYTPGCKSCNRFLKNAELPISRKDITDAEYYEELQELLVSRNLSLKEIPVLVAGTNVFQGEAEVISGYNAILAGEQHTAGDGSDSAEGTAGGGINLSLPAVIAAGLLDGVNPCAFTTLIFLLSALSVAGRSRRETLIIGLFFTITVFVTYYLIGLGFFKLIRIADSFSLVSSIIRWLLFAVLIIFAGLSFYDYGKIRAGRSREIILQLPDSVKRRMHSSIRSYSKSAALAGSSIIMGFLISIFELGCTGQIYFPTITYIIQTDGAASGFLILGLYNLAFILPLAAVFVVVYFGITSKKITAMFQANLGVVKILTGLLFLSFAVLMLIL